MNPLTPTDTYPILPPTLLHLTNNSGKRVNTVIKPVNLKIKQSLIKLGKQKPQKKHSI